MTETRCILFGCAIVLLLSSSTTAMARSLPQTFDGHDECAWWYGCTSWKTKQCFPSLPLNKSRHAIEFVDSTMAVLALFGSYVTWTLCAIYHWLFCRCVMLRRGEGLRESKWFLPYSSFLQSGTSAENIRPQSVRERRTFSGIMSNWGACGSLARGNTQFSEYYWWLVRRVTSQNTS